MIPAQGRFVVFEGGDGAGKSTQINLLSRWLREQSIRHRRTREPGGSSLAEQLRALIIAGDNAPLVELMLLMTARAAHITETIRPALENGEWILCDRFLDSTLAYQGAGLGVDPAMIQTIQYVVSKDISPELTILLDISHDDVSMRNPAPSDGIEARDNAFQRRVYQGFRDLAATKPECYLVLNARRPVRDLHRLIAERVSALMP